MLFKIFICFFCHTITFIACVTNDYGVGLGTSDSKTILLMILIIICSSSKVFLLFYYSIGYIVFKIYNNSLTMEEWLITIASALQRILMKHMNFLKYSYKKLLMAIIIIPLVIAYYKITTNLEIKCIEIKLFL